MSAWLLSPAARIAGAILGALSLGLGGYLWGRHDGRALERSASLSETVRVQLDAVEQARKQLTADQAVEIARAESMTRLTATIGDLLSRPPQTVTLYKEVPTHGAKTVPCPAGVSSDFVQRWNAAAAAADPSR